MRLQLPIVSFVSTVLVLLPLPWHWHWRAHNASTLLALVWLTLCNVVHGVNSIIWEGNTIIRYRTWCDISTKLEIGASIGIPASIMCISRYLAQVSSPHYTTPNPNNERRRMKLEIGTCGVFPIVTITLHYIVQQRRFIIYEDFECYPSIFQSVPALFILYIPSLFFSLAALVYGGVALHWLIHRRTQSQQVHSKQPIRSGVALDRYIRLVALITSLMTFSTGISLNQLTRYFVEGSEPWISWENAHSDWWTIPVFPRNTLPDAVWSEMLTSWYFMPVASVMFFGFFGLGNGVSTGFKVFARIMSIIFCLHLKRSKSLPTNMGQHTTPTPPSTAIPSIPVLGAENATAIVN